MILPIGDYNLDPPEDPPDEEPGEEEVTSSPSYPFEEEDHDQLRYHEHYAEVLPKPLREHEV